MVKCLVVDDSSAAVDLMVSHISKISELTLVGTCHSAVEAMELVKNQTVDLMFLDIEMPVMNGLEYLKTVKHPPKVIITTAYRKYAIDGYDLDIIDYLLKPISFERFVKAVERSHERFLNQKTDDYFFVNINKKHIKLWYKDLLYIESLKDYIRIHTVDQQLVVKMNIGKIYQQLPKHLFIRVHRSFIVAVEKVTAYTQKDIEIGNTEIPIGNSYAEETLRVIKL